MEVSKRHPGKWLLNLKDGLARARQLEGRTQSRCLRLEEKLRVRHWKGRERWGAKRMSEPRGPDQGLHRQEAG